MFSLYRQHFPLASNLCCNCCFLCELWREWEWRMRSTSKQFEGKNSFNWCSSIFNLQSSIWLYYYYSHRSHWYKIADWVWLWTLDAIDWTMNQNSFFFFSWINEWAWNWCHCVLCLPFMNENHFSQNYIFSCLELLRIFALDSKKKESKSFSWSGR